MDSRPFPYTGIVFKLALMLFFFGACQDHYALEGETVFKFKESDTVFSNERASTGGISLIDVDGDTDLDVFVSNGYDVSQENPTPQKNQLYINDGSGKLNFDKSSLLSEDEMFSSGSTWGDYDNDGNIDVFIANQQGQHNALFLGNGEGDFQRVTNMIVTQDSGYSYSANWVDIDLDGDLDLYVANGGISHKEEDFLYENTGNGEFRKRSEPEFTQTELSTIGGLWNDFNGDLFPDLYVSYRLEKDRIYFNKGDWKFEVYTLDSPHKERYSFPKSAGTAGDFDNDGDIDIYQTTLMGGANFLFLNDGTGNFEFREAGMLTSAGGHTYGALFSDLNNDGEQELISANWGSSLQIFSGRGNSFDQSIVKKLSERIFYASTISVGDLNGDGRQDVIIPQWPNTPGFFERNEIYQNDTGKAGNWVKIKLTGTKSNRSGIGAKIRITCQTPNRIIKQYRTVTSQQTWRSQNGLIQHFGLGSCSIIDEINVEWPSAEVSTLRRMLINRTIEVTEGYYE
jgi:hypothetical protein